MIFSSRINRYLQEVAFNRGTWLSPHYESSDPTETVLNKEQKQAFREHHRSLGPKLHRLLTKFQFSKEESSPSHLLRHNSGAVSPKIQDKINNFDKITNNPIKSQLTVYRSIDPTSSINPYDITKLQRGHVFTDHGYTSTTLSPKAGRYYNYEPEYGTKQTLVKVPYRTRRSVHPSDDDVIHNRNGADPHLKPALYRIHLPAGTKAHYLNAYHTHPTHHEVLLHRGTKFRVRGHTSTPNHHLVDLDVIGQHNKG